MSANTPGRLNIISWAVLAIYTVAVLYGITFHEQWRDEAQSWLVLQNLDFGGLLKKLPSEGHPPSWYLLLFPFVKAGAPYIIQNILSAILMTGGMYMFIFRTRLHSIVKLLLPFSYLFFYEYPIIARSYALLTLLIAFIVYVYPKRHEKPVLYALLVVALCNTHMLIFSFCMMLAGFFAYEAFNDKKLKGKILWAAVFMFAGCLYLIPYIAMADTRDTFTAFVANHTERIAQTFDYGLFTFDTGGMALLLFIAFGISLYKQPKAILLLVGGVASVVYILAYAFPGDIRHAGIIFPIMLAVGGIAANETTDTDKYPAIARYGYVLLAIVALVQMKQAFESYLNDKDNVFSDSRNAADFLKEKRLTNHIIVGQQAWAASALLPYFPAGREFYYVECERYGSYYTFDSCFEKGYWNQPAAYYVQNTYKTFQAKADSVIMVFNYAITGPTANYLELLYKSEEPVIRADEAYYIYRFKQP